MSKVLVTGATGFLGKFILKELTENNYEIVAFGRNETIGKSLSDNNIKFIKGNLSNLNDVRNAVANCDMVVHAGSLTTVWGKWKDFYTSNVLGTKNILDACIEENVKKLVYISSGSVYAGNEDKVSITEEYKFNKNNDLNFYIKSKIMAENLINSEKYKHKIYTNIIRPHGIIGKGDKCIVPRVLEVNKKIGIPLFEKGNVLIDLVPAENVAFAVRLCLEKDNLDNEIFNITNGQPKPFKSMAESLFSILKIKPKFFYANRDIFYSIGAFLEKVYKLLNITNHEPILTRYKLTTIAYSETFSIEKSKKLLGYYPKVSIEESFRSYGC